MLAIAGKKTSTPDDQKDTAAWSGLLHWHKQALKIEGSIPEIREQTSGGSMPSR
jgi:hypothetical protein